MRSLIIKILLIVCLLSSFMFVFACGETGDGSEGTSVLEQVESEYKAYLDSFAQAENVGDLSFDESLILKEEYKVGETITLPNVQNPTGNESIYIQKLVSNGFELYKTYSPLKAGDTVVFNKQGSFVACFVQENEDGTVYNKNFYLSILNKNSFDFSKLPKTINIHEEIDFGKIYFYKDGGASIANIFCINPNGQGIDVSNGIFKPNLVGEYKFTAIANNGADKEDYFVNVISDTSSLFVSDSAEIISNFDLPSWSSGTSGVLLKATPNTTIRYSNVINLASLSSITPLIEFQVMCGEFAGHEFASMGLGWHPTTFLRVKLIDAYDSNKVVEFGWRTSEWYAYPIESKANSFLMTSTCSADMEKWYVNSKGEAALGRFTFCGSDGISSDAPFFNILYDYENNSSYYIDGGTKKFFSDYSSGEIWGANAFDKFTTGEVYLEIKIAEGFTGTGGIVVTSVGGNSLAGVKVDNLEDLEIDSFVDKVRPSLLFSSPEKLLSNMPKGYVDVKYPLPNCYAMDTISGKCDVDISVINKTNGKNYSVSKGCFIPEESGEFAIVYAANDCYGNLVSRTLEVLVKDETTPLIKFSFDGLTPAKQGMNYQLPNIKVEGGSGDIEYTYKIMYNGKEVFADEYNCIFLSEIGSLKYVFTAKDYLGTALFADELVVDIGIGEEAFINIEKSLPKYVRKGDVVTFPAFDVFYYGANGLEPDSYLEVNGVKLGADRKYTVPENASELIVKYSAISDKEYFEIFEIEVLDKYSKVENAFSTENVIFSSLKTDYLEFTVDNDAVIKAPCPVLATEFSINFSFDTEKSSVKLLLVDGYNSQNVIAIEFSKIVGSTKIAMLINEKHYYEITPRIYEDGIATVYLNFDSSNGRLSDFRSVLYSYIADGVYTDLFTGFSNDACYVEMEITNTQLAKFNLYSLCNQSFDKFSNAIAYGPQIQILGEIKSTEVFTGDIITVPMAKAYDLFDGECTVVVSVKSPSGEELVKRKVCNKEYTFTIGGYGTYTVTFESADNSNGSTILTFTLNNVDTVAPTITVDMNDKTCEINSTIKIKEATVTDNISSNLSYFVCIIGVDNVYQEVEVGASYKFEEKGNYKIVYLAKDEFGNIGRTVINITVK